MTTRLLLADDHVLFVEALTQLLVPRFEVVDVVNDGKALQTSARKHKPDVIVTDVTMPLMNGLDSIRSLRDDSPRPKAIFLSIHADSQLAQECLNSGGSAFLTKECSFEELVSAIEAVLADQQYLSPAVTRGPEGATNHFEQLTLRQREILQMLAEGKTIKEVASAMNLSVRTVEWHKYRMMRCLEVKRSAELIQCAVRMKLVA